MYKSTESDSDHSPSREGCSARPRMELRRGVLTLAVLAALRSEEYGYSLRKKLAAAGIDIEEGTLYPLMRRLEAQGMLESEWRDSDVRSKRYYRVSAAGAAVLRDLSGEWESLVSCLGNLLEIE